MNASDMQSMKMFSNPFTVLYKNYVGVSAPVNIALENIWDTKCFIKSGRKKANTGNAAYIGQKTSYNGVGAAYPLGPRVL